MTIWWLVLILAAIGSAGIAFIWMAVRMGGHGSKGQAKPAKSYEEQSESEVEHIFSDDFREELRNRGRLHFEKIISDNAMFLQQDLQMTTTQINEYMKTELTGKLQQEFTNYEQSIADAKQMAIEAIQKTNTAIDEQRKMLSDQVHKEAVEQKERIVQNFANNMTDIVNHYILSAIGDQIDLGDQLEYILGQLENNKQAIVEDVQNAG